jgi:hypothetical protein
MFWGAFSYDKKGPCHCWLPETAQEKKEAEEYMAKWNSEAEANLKNLWELETRLKRLGLRSKGGRKPEWKFTKKTGKLVRDGKGGIDWYRYQSKILLPKLFPFYQELKKERPNAIVQEDKAPSHNHWVQQQVYSSSGVQRLPWCGNSPDLNAIEPCWYWMKRATTKKGALKNRAEAIRAWEKQWDELPQSKIQAWIERVPFHIQEIIRLEGGNEYKEGRRQVD